MSEADLINSMCHRYVSRNVPILFFKRANTARIVVEAMSKPNATENSKAKTKIPETKNKTEREYEK